jgi:hypothetical protein
VGGNFFGLGTGVDASAESAGSPLLMSEMAFDFIVKVGIGDQLFLLGRLGGVKDFTFLDDGLAALRFEVVGISSSSSPSSSIFPKEGSSGGSALTLTTVDLDGRPPRREVGGFMESLLLEERGREARLCWDLFLGTVFIICVGSDLALARLAISKRCGGRSGCPSSPGPNNGLHIFFVLFVNVL